MTTPQQHPDVDSVIAGPFRVGSEQRWRVRLTDGTPAVLATLLPELARDPALRRRYARDVGRRAQLKVEGLAPLVGHGVPQTGQGGPWRLRTEPVGETLHALLQRRAPLPVPDATHIGASLADVLGRLHAQGVVVRDLSPRAVVLTDAGPVLTDVGLARIDILCTRTAASLVLEGSPYASPEQLRKTVVDGRSDIYSLGVILWEMLTGGLPHGDGLAILRPDDEIPSLSQVRPAVPSALSALVERCIAGDPEARPASADAVARALRGDVLRAVVPKTVCQSCGAPLRLGQRLCTACGKLAVVFKPWQVGDGDSYRLELVRLKENTSQLLGLQRILAPLTAGPLPRLNFIIGDQRLYSKNERARGIKLPNTLFEGLEHGSALALKQRFDSAAIKTRVHRASPGRLSDRRVQIGVGVAAVVTVILCLMAGPLIGLVLGGAALGAAFLIMHVARKRGLSRTPLLTLRQGPAALPASDPLVARLAALIDAKTPDDVRERVGELALSVQNLVDHHASLKDAADRAELDAVTEPVEQLVTLIETQIRRIAAIDVELETLNEGALVRGLAAAKARDATPTEQAGLLNGLDRLRMLEDDRAQAIHRLLSASDLLQRSVELGLSVTDEQAAIDRQVAMALQALA